MIATKLDIKGLGSVHIGQHHYNNTFMIGWGGPRDPDGPIYHMDNLIDVAFEGGQWNVERQRRLKKGGLKDVEVSPELKAEIIRVMLTEPSVRESLEKYRKAAIKRLEVSVPRLERELKASVDVLSALKAVSFKP